MQTSNRPIHIPLPGQLNHLAVAFGNRSPEFKGALDRTVARFESMSARKMLRKPKLKKRYQRVPGVPMLGTYTVFSFYRGVLIGSPESEYLYQTFRSRRTARDYIKKEMRNGR